VITHNIFHSLSLCSVGTSLVLFFHLKEQETAKKGGKKKEKEVAVQETTEVQDIVAVQNIYPSTFLPWKKCLNHTWPSIHSLRY
jgi:hypothetical protein